MSVRWTLLFAKVLLISAASLAALFIVYFWVAGSAGKWLPGNAKTGDLLQHYAAGSVAREGGLRAAYQGHSMGRWVADYHERLKDSSKVNAKTDYVYSPTMVWICTKGAAYPFTFWLETWFWLLPVFYALAWLLLSHSLLAASPRCGEQALLFFTFPVFFSNQVVLQNAPLSLLVLAGSLFLLHRHYPAMAGALLVFWFYKPHWLPTIVVFMGLAGQWRFSLALLAATILWILSEWLLFGFDCWTAWLGSMATKMEGLHSIKDGNNQTWIGFFELVLGYGLPAQIAGGLVSLALLAAPAIVLQRQALKTALPAPHVLALGSALLAVTGLHLGHYDLVLVLPWWLVTLPWATTPARRWICTIPYWSGWLAAAGMFTGFPLATLPLTIWLLTTLSWVIDWRETFSRRERG